MTNAAFQHSPFGRVDEVGKVARGGSMVRGIARHVLLVISVPIALAATLSHADVPLTGISKVTAGQEHTCALTTGGGVKCWGNNRNGVLGDGTSGNWRRIPANVFGLATGVVAISAGYSHTCALSLGGGVKCWGDNLLAQLGTNDNFNRTEPTNVVGLSTGVAAIATGGFHTCALMTTGGVKCFGYNGSGQVGDPASGFRSKLVDVVGLTAGVVAITAGLSHTCALTTGGGVKCWGSNFNGPTPVDVAGLTSGIAAIAAGSGHTCALTEGGGVKCWGGNQFGQLGDNSTDDRLNPVDVAGLATGVTAIATSNNHTCATTTSGAMKCWGDAQYGQLGDNSTGDANLRRLSPVDVAGLAGGVTAMATGVWHTCANTASSGIKCWGSNAVGQVGNGTFGNQYLSPVSTLVYLGKRPSDVNGDLKSDLLFRNTQTGQVTAWLMNGTATISTVGILPPSATSVRGVADFDDDGFADLLVTKNDGTATIMYMDRNGIDATSSSNLLGFNSNWQITQSGDFTGYGLTDILARQSTGSVTLWLMGGFRSNGPQPIQGPDPNWRVTHVADFNGDGKADILWRSVDGAVRLWLLDNLYDPASTTIVNLLGPEPNWSISHVGDFNGDGKADILWRSNSGAVTLWLMDGATVTSAVGLLGPDPNWSITHVGDFNGDGKADILWRKNDGSVTQWLMNGNSVTSTVGLLGADPNWRVTHLGDYDGDGKADILWRNTVDGSITMWLMNGAAIATAAGILGPGPWVVVPPMP
jgi:alpha-tubulin suppressor-like RCC1 family protein